MDDDLGVPAALAVLHDTVREGNRLLADGGPDGELASVLSGVLGMLDVLGINPLDEQWASSGGSDERLSSAVGSLVALALEQRQAARARKDWAAADAVRDRLAAAGIAIEDTPTGPRWTLAAAGENGS